MARKHSECKSALQPGQMAGDLGAQLRRGPRLEYSFLNTLRAEHRRGWISKGSLGDQAMEDVVLALEARAETVTLTGGLAGWSPYIAR